MNRIEKNNSQSLKREKLKSFISERCSQKNAQATARKETARRLISERRTRLVAERTYARQRKESLKGLKIKSRIKANAVKSGKTVSLSGRPELEKRKVFAGGGTQSGSGENEAKPFPAVSANNKQAQNRRELLAYFEKNRAKKSEAIAGKIKQKEAAAALLLAQKRKASEIREEERAVKAGEARSQEEAKQQEISVQQQALTTKAEKEKTVLSEKGLAVKKLSRPEKRRQLLLHLTKLREAKREVLVCKKEQKEAAAVENQARRAELKKQKQSLYQPKPAVRAQKEVGETISDVIGQTYKRQQLLLYLKKRKSGEKTFAIQRRELKKITETAIPEAIIVPVLPEITPVIAPVIMPPITPLESIETAPENVLAAPEEKPGAGEEEKPTGRRLKLPSARGKKQSSDSNELDVVSKPALLPRKPFGIAPFLKAHFAKIFFLLLALGWLVEIAMLNKRLENVRQQVEQSASIARPRVSNEVITIAKAPLPDVGMTRVEGIRDPFSNELWRIQEITPAQARSIGIRPPAPSGIIKPIAPILIIKQPEFTPPEVVRAIPESAKLVRIPQVTIPQVGSVSTPSAPVTSLRFRGILNVAGIDYFFIESANGGYRVRVGDTVEGFKIYDYRDGVLYFAKDGYTYQLNEETQRPPLSYRGRMIMAGQEYFFLEGQRTYRVVVGEEIEGYQLIKRVGDYLYFIKDDRLYYLKQE